MHYKHSIACVRNRAAVLVCVAYWLNMMKMWRILTVILTVHVKNSYSQIEFLKSRRLSGWNEEIILAIHEKDRCLYSASLWLVLYCILFKYCVTLPILSSTSFRKIFSVKSSNNSPSSTRGSSSSHFKLTQPENSFPWRIYI